MDNDTNKWDVYKNTGGLYVVNSAKGSFFTPVKEHAVWLQDALNDADIVLPEPSHNEELPF